jgi:hypothetical protein
MMKNSLINIKKNEAQFANSLTKLIKFFMYKKSKKINFQILTLFFDYIVSF